MKRRAVLGALLVSCAVDYRADEAAYQCVKFGHCADGSANTPGGTGGTGAGGAMGSGATAGSTTGGVSGSGVGGTPDASAGMCGTDDAGLCENPDPVNCTTRCEEGEAGPLCIVEGSDEDGDDHLSAACTFAPIPGDDCDDGVLGVHPGATESCNGLDDDCNGLKDTEDGLALGGTIEPFAVGDAPAPLIWVPSLGVYAIAWTERSAGSPHLRLTLLDAAGERIPGADADLTAPGEDDTATDIVYGTDEFRILTTTVVSNVGQLHYREVRYDPTAEGGVSGDAGMTFQATPRAYVSDVRADLTRPTMLSLDAYGVLATWMNFDVANNNDATVYAQAIAPGGALVGPPELFPLNGTAWREVNSAKVDDVAAYVWTTCPFPAADAGSPVDAGAPSDCVTSFTRVPLGATGDPPITLNAPGTHALAATVASNESVFMVAWTENNIGNSWSLNYSVLSPDGTVLCGPKQYLTRPALEGPGFYFAMYAVPSLAPLPDGTFAVLAEYDENAGTLLLGTLDASCTATEGAPLVVTPAQHAFVNEPRIAASGSSIVTLWVDRYGADMTLFTRTLSPLLCDPADADAGL